MLPGPYDFTTFWEHPPKSILVLPPLNQTATVGATYGYLSTVTRPLAERGYYVFPVEVVDQLFKANGMPTAAEMHEVPLEKVAEITGADAVLFVTVTKYATSYNVISSATVVRIDADLVDTRTGMLLWKGKGFGDGGGAALGDPGDMLVTALVYQIIYSSRDAAHDVSAAANHNMIFTERSGLPTGPYDAKYKPPKGRAAVRPTAPPPLT